MDKAKEILGENWFLYWKVSPSLWSSKIEELPFDVVAIPLNWGLHHTSPKEFDFGMVRQESNLKKLVEVIEEKKKKAVFFLPLTPTPFLTRGGLPDFLNASPSLNADGLYHVVLNREEDINVMCSFFDPQFFRYFSLYTRELNRFFNENKVSVDLFALHTGYFKEGKFYSFLEDYGRVFHGAFSSYLEALKKSNLSSLKEKQEIEKFKEFIYQLYRDEAKSNLVNFWEGELKVGFFCADSEDFISRSVKEGQVNYYQDLINASNNGIFSSSILLNNCDKNFSLQLKTLLLDTLYNNKFRDPIEDKSLLLSPLVFFRLYDRAGESLWEKQGPIDYLQEYYSNTIGLLNSERELPQYFSSSKINLLPGGMVKKKDLKKILRCFMEGGRFLIDESGLDTEVFKKLEMFILENSITREKLHLFIDMQNIILGEGRILMFKGEDLKKLSKTSRWEFFEKVFKTFHLCHFGVDLNKNFQTIWLARDATSREVSFSQIRKLVVFNPQKKKQRFKVKLPEKMFLLSSSAEGQVVKKESTLEVSLWLMNMPDWILVSLNRSTI